MLTASFVGAEVQSLLLSLHIGRTFTSSGAVFSRQAAIALSKITCRAPVISFLEACVADIRLVSSVVEHARHCFVRHDCFLVAAGVLL